MNHFIVRGYPTQVNWTFNNIAGEEFSLEGCTYRLYYSMGAATTLATGVTHSGNVLTWSFTPGMQWKLGYYNLALEVYTNNVKTLTVTYPKAFILLASASGITEYVEDVSTVTQNDYSTLNIVSSVDFGRFSAIVPVVGSDGFWYINGARIVDGEGNNVAADHTVTYHSDTNYIVIDEGRVDAQGQSIAQTITSLATALSLAASDHTTAASDHTQAASDHTTAAADHTTAASDHTTAASDHSTASSDHTASAAATSRANAAAAAAEHQVDVKRGYGIKTVTQPVTAENNGGTNTIRVTTDDDRVYDFYIKNGTSSCGFFLTGTALATAIPSPEAGDYAYVSKSGDGTFPAYIYVCTSDGEWTATTNEYDGDNAVDVLDVLDSTRTNAALSANQGKVLKSLIDALAIGAKVTLSASPTTIYKGVETSISLSGSISGVTPTSMTIKDGDTTVATSSNSQSVSGTATATVSTNTKEYTCLAVYNGTTLQGSVKVNARNPIYCGMGTSYSAVAVAANKLSPTTTAARTYEKTASANGQHFYLLVPSDITDVSTFTMGGAPFAMNTVSEQTIDGVTYKVHESTVAYDSGTSVSVTAS